MTGSVIVRDAGEDDLPAILDIYNNAVLNETSIWNDDIADLADRRAWWQARVSRGFPVYVAEVDGTVAGYGTFGDFRPHQGYRFTVEHSIYVAASRAASRHRQRSPHASDRRGAAHEQARDGRRYRGGQRRFDRASPPVRFRRNGADAASGFQVRPLARPCPDAEAARPEPGERGVHPRFMSAARCFTSIEWGATNRDSG